MVNLTIDGKQITVKKSATIYEAAKEAGIDIPVLCYAKKLLPYGACRICLVEVEQMKGRLIPSCTTPVTEGMVVKTTSPDITKVRKTVLEFLLVNHVVECPVCDKAGECDLQDLTFQYEVVKNRFEGEKFNLPTDEVNPLIERNMNRCVLCGKCVRVCDEIVGYGSYSFINRGFETKIATAFDRGLNCEFCGQCVSMCPVGAILPRPFKFKARPWQLSEVDTVCGYCGNGCTVTLGVLNDKVETIRFNDKTGVNDGNLCIRGRFGYGYIHHDDRLRKPLIRKDGQLVEAEWNEAIEAVVKGFNKAGNEKGLGILSGARMTNEELFLLKNLAKTLGTGNLDHSGGECYKGLTEGLMETLGVKASTGTFPQVESCDAILAIRSDFYETHPVFGMVVNQAVKRHDAQLFIVSDKKGKFSKLPHAKTLLGKPGTEIQILNSMAQVLLSEGLAVTDGVEGVEELKAALAKYAPADVAERTGVSVDAIKAAARALAGAKKSAILLAYGLPYAAHSKELAIAAANLSILTGNAGREGSGLYLCGEKSNSQGAIDLAILPEAGAMGAKDMLEAARNGNLSALYVVGEDLLTSYPDRDKVEAALKGLSFLVVQDIFLSPTAQQADVVLPASSFAEKDGTFTNAERRIQRVRKGVSSPGDAKTDFEIFELLSARFGRNISYTAPAAVFADIAANVAEYAGIQLDAVGPQGVVWGGDDLALKKKRVVAVDGPEAPQGDFLLVTGSSLYHSGTMSTRAKGSLSVVAEPYIEFGQEDAKKLQVTDGDVVTVKAEGGQIKLKAKVDRRLPQGVVFAPYHFASAEINRIYKGASAVAVELSK
ncbi:NADH-quinone oxidoreductase subunit NuoG [Desulfuromonas sp. AOP6]|uniref:NADH-quinone oxidoreductase subunit NuoG n=1 Tax=Desulfuromonas sp. AOP6 TaxID=1566351 RepID=UPI001274315F|nr:NADH-quinone oxidoreductase subunit NuoG [Desulfuromonas sp. AOP6]BCA78362.1 NADH dehydrogenase subunit G [Desulfuromonas sp. AOP6]